MSRFLHGRSLFSRCLSCVKPWSRHQSQPAKVVATADHQFKPGDKLHGYTVEQVLPVPELYLTAVTLTHDKTGAQHLHISRDDANNVFGVALRTTPMDSTGVPHILEHTVLCGSHKYPVRDPFFKMLTRSLSTFMNAFTANDWTMYPFSTQNKQDFENLLSVYLDCAFFPNLRQLDFSQEGWRLEHEDPENPNTPIIFKGVVFNEMKGVFSNSQSVFAQAAQNHLLPSHTYGVVSGGHPTHIPDLTWQQLKDFHASHYHPSNSRFYTYGNLPLERHLELINDLALCKFDKIDPNTSVPFEPRWNEPREMSISCQPDPTAPDPAKQTTVSANYILNDITDPFETFTLQILSYLLTNGEKSPFYQSLLETNIGSDFSPSTGFSGYTKDATFSVGLQGIKTSDVDKVKQIIEDTIVQTIQTGFEAEVVEAVLHKIELSIKHQSDNFGLNLGVSLLSPWIHEGNPVASLLVNQMVEKFKAALVDNPKFLQQKLEQYFKNNPHRLTLVMSPDENYEADLKKKEEEQLQSMVQALTEAERKQVYDNGLMLAAEQNKNQDLSCLPTLHISDIKKEGEKVKIDDIYSDGISLQLCSQPTNGITYFRAVSNIGKLAAELKPFVPLFCNVVTRMGAGSMDYKELSLQEDLKTGGLSASVLVDPHHTEPNSFEQGILLSSFALDRNVESMYQLWTEIFNRLDLTDLNRLTTLVMMTASEMSNSLVGAGHRFAMTHAASSMHPAMKVQEAMSGLTQVALMKEIAEMSDLQPIVEHLKGIAKHVLNQKNIRCSLNATPEYMTTASKHMGTFLQKLKKGAKSSPMKIITKDPEFTSAARKVHFELPFQVNYMGMSVATVPYTHTDHAKLKILGKLMSSRFLHREIREKGGAYGSGAVANSSVFSFFSYRDPNSMSTLEVFDRGIEWVKQGSFSQQDIDETKLSLFSQVDMPTTPGNRGQRQFLHGIDDAMKEKHRSALFAVSKDDIIDVAERYLTPDKRTSSVSFLGPENSATKDSNEWTVKTL